MSSCLTPCMSRYPVLVAGHPGQIKYIVIGFGYILELFLMNARKTLETVPGVDTRVLSISAAFSKADDARQNPGAIISPHYKPTTAITLGQEDTRKYQDMRYHDTKI